jgi:hypothetical protein
VLTVESDWLEHGCPGCGVLAVGHGRRCRVLHDAPSLGRVTEVRWLSRVRRRLEPSCPTTTFTEQHPIAPPRAVLTVRAVRWPPMRSAMTTPRCRGWPNISASPGRPNPSPQCDSPRYMYALMIISFAALKSRCSRPERTIRPRCPARCIRHAGIQGVLTSASTSAATLWFTTTVVADRSSGRDSSGPRTDPVGLVIVDCSLRSGQ